MTEQLRALSEAASPGEWEARLRGVFYRGGRWTQIRPDDIGEADAAFIVAAVNYVRERLAAATSSADAGAGGRATEDVARAVAEVRKCVDFVSRSHTHDKLTSDEVAAMLVQAAARLQAADEGGSGDAP